MPESSKENNKIVDHLFRHEYGKMVAVLIRYFGYDHLSMAEDVVQDTFIKALKNWGFDGIPDNPEAWLHRVAKNRAIDLIRSKNRKAINNEKVLLEENQALDTLFLDSEISDSQLRLIFLCCNLELDNRDIIAITLKIVSGFGVKEIAKALQQKEETIKKRIQRAKSKLRDQEKHSAIDNDSTTEIHTALKIVYLIFNEGYYSQDNETLIRKDLCAEAMRLGKILTDHKYTSISESHALMAMMCYHSSRLKSRNNEWQFSILLKDQDRKLWDQKLIKIGHSYLGKSMLEEKISIYHLEASISAQHCMSKSFQETNWPMLAKLYELLLAVKPFPSVQLNLVVVYIQYDEIEKATSSYFALSPDQFQPNPYFYYAIGASLYEKKNNIIQAKNHLKMAMENTDNDTELLLLADRYNRLLETKK